MSLNYEIKSKSDFLTGSYLVIVIEENELDKHALHTIQADCPDFILPFHYKRINGAIELVYKIGTKSKLLYFSGDFAHKEYIELWQSLLTPLLECGDWFMDPSSFALDAEYIYYDKNKKIVSYVYIPTINGCSDYDAFHEMAVEVSKKMTATDVVLENKVLRSIIKDFNPEEFLKMLKEHIPEKEALPSSACVDQTRGQTRNERQNESTADRSNKSTQGDDTSFGFEESESLIPEPDVGEDITIDLQSDVKYEQSRKEREKGGYRVFSGRGKRKKANGNNVENNLKQEVDLPVNELLQEPNQLTTPAPVVNKQDELIEITQDTLVTPDGTGLRYVGSSHLPQFIEVKIAEGEIFTIGRFDAAAGKQQSSFEFDKKTKAVSRRHAVIERQTDGYKIVDLSSSAGTFVNDRKIPPNTPFGLEAGIRVSFGNCGANYVWEVS